MTKRSVNEDGTLLVRETASDGRCDDARGFGASNAVLIEHADPSLQPSPRRDGVNLEGRA